MYKLLLLAGLFVAVQADGKAQYKFELEVHDPHGGGVQTRKEERNGDSTQGEYTIAEKDGSKTKVQYTVYGHHHGHDHHEEHHGHHYGGAQYKQESSGYHGEQGHKATEGHSSSAVSSGLKYGSGHESSGYQSGHLSSLGSQSQGYHSGSGQAGYHFGQASSSGSHSGLTLGSLGYDSKLGYGSESGKAYESHSSFGGSGGYKSGQSLSSIGSTGYQHSGYGYGQGSAGLGHYSGGSQSHFGYQSGHGSEQKYSHGNALESAYKSYEVNSDLKKLNAYGSSSYQGGHEIKLSGGPTYHGVAEEYKHEVSYKKPQTVFYKDQKSTPKYESGFHPIPSPYKSESEGKYHQYQSNSGAVEAKGYANGGYKASGQAKSYHNFITYESGKGDKKHYHHEPSYHQESSYHHEPSYHHEASQQSAYKGSGSNEGFYGSVSSHVQPTYHSYHQAGGYKAEAAGNFGGYKSKYPAPLVVHKPEVHEVSEFESSAYTSGKGGYHYYGASENNNGQKTGYSSFQKIPEIGYGSKGGYGASQGGYSLSQGGYGKAQGGYSLSHGAGYSSSHESLGSSHEGYGSAKGYGSFQEGSGYSKGYGSSHGSLEASKGYSSSQGSLEASKGYSSSQGYSSKSGYSSEYSSGEAATSTLKLHTHGADVEQITKHIIPPKYHDGKY